MRVLRDFLLILLGLTLGFVLGDGVHTYLDYLQRPMLYQLQSAPWYVSIIFTGLIGLALVVLELLALRAIRKRNRRKEEERKAKEEQALAEQAQQNVAQMVQDVQGEWNHPTDDTQEKE